MIPMRVTRSLAALSALAAALAFGDAPATAQENTPLADKTGTVELQAPGNWSLERSDHTLAASGFLGLTRAQIFVQVYAQTASADVAGGKWKKWREARAKAAYLPYEGDARRWTTQGKRSTEFVRVLAGPGASAVAWVALKGPPSGLESDAFAILGTVKFTKKGPGAAAGGGGDEKSAAPKTYKDPDFRIEITLPAGLQKDGETKTDLRRFLALRGTLGDDAEAYLDVYSFPAYDRAEAVAHWWRETERRGWADAVRIEGDGTDFRVLIQDRTWNRYVRIMATKAGVYAVKIDVEADSEGDALELLEQIESKGALEVLEARPQEPRVPQGFKAVADHPTHAIFAADGVDATKLSKVIQRADVLVGELTKLEPWEQRRGQVHIHADQAAFDAAVRTRGGTKGAAAYWSEGERIVHTHAAALGMAAGKEQLLLALGREAVARRLGFPAPFWIEYGIGQMVASSAGNKGRATGVYEALEEAAGNGAAGTVDFETARWWTHADSRTNKHRLAMAWAFTMFILEGGQVSKKWSPSFHAYMDALRDSGDPAEASKAFKFARHGEFVEEFKKRMRKL
jgi:hypothetical protein